MKKAWRGLMILVACTLLTGCVPDKVSNTSASGAYQQVLQGKTKIVYNGSTVELNAVDAGLTGEKLILNQLAVADLDADDVSEVILSVDLASGYEGYGFLVLDWRDGVVYGYDFVYRALMELKADGTFSFSSGAADSGFGYARFGNTAEIVSMAYSEMLADGNIRYHVNGETVSEDQFAQAVRSQYQKQDAQWYDVSGANLSSILK